MKITTFFVKFIIRVWLRNMLYDLKAVEKVKASLKFVLFFYPGVIPCQFNQTLNPPSGILTKLGGYITPTLVRNCAKYFFPKPHSFVYRRDQNFKISPLLTIF